MLKILALFGIGLATDFLWTGWMLAAAKGRPVWAGVGGFATALNGLLFVGAFLSWPEARTVAGAFAYCIGCAIASWFLVRRTRS